MNEVIHCLHRCRRCYYLVGNLGMLYFCDVCLSVLSRVTSWWLGIVSSGDLQWQNKTCINKLESIRVFHTRKFKEGICCGGHLAVTSGGELLYLQIFLSLSPLNNFVTCELPFSRGLKIMHANCLSRGESRSNECSRQIRRYNNSLPYVMVNMAAAP